MVECVAGNDTRRLIIVVAAIVYLWAEVWQPQNIFPGLFFMPVP
jgi:hypothetical protein